MPETNSNFTNPPVPKPPSTGLRKIIWGVIGIAVVIVAAVFIFKPTAQPEPQGPAVLPGTPVTTEPQLQIKQTDIPETKLPEKFPSDIPIETGAKILQNYNAETEDGRFQATRVFESAKSLSENFTLYKDFFSQNGWSVTDTVDEAIVKLVSAAKDNIRAQVTIRESPTNKIRTVDISVTYLP